MAKKLISKINHHNLNSYQIAKTWDIWPPDMKFAYDPFFEKKKKWFMERTSWSNTALQSFAILWSKIGVIWAKITHLNVLLPFWQRISRQKSIRAFKSDSMNYCYSKGCKSMNDASKLKGLKIVIFVIR